MTTSKAREEATELVKKWLIEDCHERPAHAESMKGAFKLTGRITEALEIAENRGAVADMEGMINFLDRWCETTRMHPQVSAFDVLSDVIRIARKNLNSLEKGLRL